MDTTTRREITNEQIETLRSEAAAAGDLITVALCEIALHGEASGLAAIEYAVERGETIAKHTDPTEGAREDLDPDEAREIAAEDSHLIYCRPDAGDWERNRERARAECAQIIADALA